MATITTTTNANPLIYPSQTQIERVGAGDMWVLVAASTANTYELWRSTNAGASWALALSTVRANVQEVGSIQCLRSPYNQLVWTYRTYESGQDRVYIRTISDLGAGTLSWNAELLMASATAGSAGAVYNGVDMCNTTVSGQYHYTVVAVGVQQGSTNGAALFAAYGSTLAALRVNAGLISGPSSWIAIGIGRVTPSIDIEHTGDGHTATAPNLWCAWGRSSVYMVKLAWTGNGWSSPTSPVQLNPITLTPAQDSISARWDGSRFNVIVPDPSSTSVVTVFERNRSNSTTTIRQTPTHPTGVVRNCTLGYNSVSGDIRVFAVGTSTTVLYYIDFIRATGLWSSWTSVVATAVLGTTGNNYSVRRATNGRYEVVTAHATPTPNTLVHTAQSLSYAPNAPVWDTASMQQQSGASDDVNTPLTLDWFFSDPDPADTQSAYAVSRQIGAGALAYWRASDSTWQVAEVQNSSGTTALTFLAGWQSGTDAATTYKVKTWDSASVASAYGDGFVILPSTVVNPAVSAPTPAQVLTADSVTLIWSAAEQTAWRARLMMLGAADTFATRTVSSGWGTGEYGGAWTTSGGSASDYSVGSNVALQSNGTVNVLRTALIDTLSTDHTVWADISVNVASPTGAAVTKWLAFRAADLSNYYVAQLIVSTAGLVTLTLQKRVAGTLSAVGPAGVQVGTGHASGEVWRVVADASGSTISVKAWKPAVQAEPQSWQIQATNDTSLSAGTKAGPLSRLEASNSNTLPVVFTVDNFYAQTGVVYDSGWSNTAVTSLVVPARLGDLSAWLLGLRTRNLEALPSTEQLVHVTVDFVEPAAALVVPTPDPGNGWISVAITNPAVVGAQPAISDQDVYARPNLSGANLLTNPGFETNTTGWQGSGGATLTRSVAQFHSGVAAGLLTPDGVSASPRIECASGQLVVAAVGQSWTVDGWLRPTTANKPLQLGINWHDGAGTLLSSSLVQFTPLAGGWLYTSFTAVAPASTGKVGVFAAVVSTPAAGDTAYLDDVRLRRSDSTVGSRVGVGVASGATVQDWHAISGTDYEYRVLTRGVNGTSTYGPWTA